MPLLVDLFCGRGGWSKGFLLHGWEVRGYDLQPQPDYPGEFIQQDVLELAEGDLAHADFICCSSPCEQFSVHCMKHFHKNPPWPFLGVQLFEHARTICDQSGKPYVMENVRCAQQFVGHAVQHCGPFYLWGNAVPAIFPRELYRVLKGMTQRRINLPGAKFTEWDKRVRNASAAWRSAHVAEIPLEVASYVARAASNLVGSARECAASVVI